VQAFVGLISWFYIQGIWMTYFVNLVNLVWVIWTCRTRLFFSFTSVSISLFIHDFTLLTPVWFRTHLAAGPAARDWWTRPYMFDVSGPLLCVCCSSHMNFMFITFASLTLGILSVTVHVFHVPKTHRWFPLYDFMRSARPGRCLIGFTGFIQCCNVVPFFVSKGNFKKN